MFRYLLAAALALAAAVQGQAALIITVGNADLNPSNPTGTIPVYVQSDAGTANLQAFSLQLLITPNTPGSTGQVAFVDPPTDAQNNNPNYAFFNNSLNKTFMLPSGSAGTTNYLNDTYMGGDGTLLDMNGNTTTVSIGTTPQLLLLLDVTRLTGSPPVPGETFSVSVADNGFTAFIDGNNDPIAFSSVSGTITTPEPATLAVFGGLAAAGFGLVRRRRAAA